MALKCRTWCDGIFVITNTNTLITVECGANTHSQKVVETTLAVDLIIINVQARIT